LIIDLKLNRNWFDLVWFIVYTKRKR